MKAKPRASAAVQAIWRTVRRLPRGSTASYGEVARRAGFPGRARLVGHALRMAPDDMDLPWFRVTAARGRIAFPSGSKQRAEQLRRLRRDGVRIQEGRVVVHKLDLDALLWKV
jgi:methylated-DNA-protein-cysteine methyltransferase-like protein